MSSSQKFLVIFVVIITIYESLGIESSLKRSKSWIYENGTFALDLKLNSEKVNYARCNIAQQGIKCKVSHWNFKENPETGEDCEAGIPIEGVIKRTSKFISLKHMNDRFIIVQYREIKNGQEYLIAGIIDMNLCSFVGKLYEESNGERKHTFVNEILPYDDETLDLVISKNLDHKIQTYIIKFDEEGRIKGNIRSLNTSGMDLNFMDFDEIDKKLFIRGFDYPDNTYKLVYNNETLLSYGTPYRTSSWSDKKQYVICRMSELRVDFTNINCDKFSSNGTRIHNSTIEFPRDVWLIRARTIGDDEILIVTEDVSCLDEQCWRLTLTRIHNDGSYVKMKYPFKCSGEREMFAIHAEKTKENSLKIYYACEQIEEDSVTIGGDEVRMSHLTVEDILW